MVTTRALASLATTLIVFMVALSNSHVALSLQPSLGVKLGNNENSNGHMTRTAVSMASSSLRAVLTLNTFEKYKRSDDLRVR